MSERKLVRYVVDPGTNQMFASQRDLVALLEQSESATPEIIAIRDWLVEQIKNVNRPKFEGLFPYTALGTPVRILFQKGELYFNVRDLVNLLGIRCRQIVHQSHLLKLELFNLSTPEQLKNGFGSVIEKLLSIENQVAEYDVSRN